MEGKDKTVKTELGEVGPSGFVEAQARKSDPDLRFWRSLRKQVEHGPAVRVTPMRRGRA